MVLSVALDHPPFEEDLLQNTLWPEIQKLYGHGYELLAVAADPSGTVVVSSCKAATPDHAAIIVWDTRTWLEVKRLALFLSFFLCGAAGNANCTGRPMPAFHVL